MTPAEGIYLQKALGQSVEHSTPFSGSVEYLGAADVSYLKDFNRAFAVITVFRIHHTSDGALNITVVDESISEQKIEYPYIPGLLVFREGPALESAWNILKVRPDLLLFDGAGIAHPRRCGLAVHLGWRWDVPAFGCAKSRLIGEGEEPGLEKGSTSSLFDKNTRVGTIIRTRTRVKPLFVSPGYHTSFQQSTEWTLKLTDKYRLPEPIRFTDKKTKSLSRTFVNSTMEKAQ